MFSKKPEFDSRPSPGNSTAGGTFSVLGPDLEVRGDLLSTADLHIDGKVDGNITCSALVQSEGSVITGSVVSDNVRIAGKVNGSVTAGVLVLSRTGRIEGDVIYDEVIMEQGAKVNGKLAHRPPELKLSLVADSTEAS